MKLLQLMVINEMDADYDHALQVGDYRDNIAILTARYLNIFCTIFSMNYSQTFLDMLH